LHCDEPTCAQVCPADAIKKGEDGIVHSSLKPRCIACSNCVLACPFGIPKMMEPEQLSCAVYYSQEDNRLECPCHKGFFSIADGSVLQGPPSRPLPKIILESRGGELVAVDIKTS
jgi:Fe-S-cluster-containing dehydrogenase component